MMDTLLSLLNALSSGVISLALIGLVLSAKVHDGIVIKVGLISMAFGFGSIALRMVNGLGPEDLYGLARSLLLVNAGLAVVIVGYLLRRSRSGHPIRRASDWAASGTAQVES